MPFAGFCEGNSGFCGTEPTIGRVQCNCSCKSSSLDAAPVTVVARRIHTQKILLLLKIEKVGWQTTIDDRGCAGFYCSSSENIQTVFLGSTRVCSRSQRLTILVTCFGSSLDVFAAQLLCQHSSPCFLCSESSFWLHISYLPQESYCKYSAV